MGRAAACHHTGKIPACYRVDGRTANAHFRVRVFWVQPARTHEAVLTACRIGPDRTRFHVRGPAERRLYTILGRFLQHLNGRFTNGHIPEIEHLYLLFFFFGHNILPF